MIYSTKVKERKIKEKNTYFMLVGEKRENLTCLPCLGGVQRIDHKLEPGPCAHYIVKYQERSDAKLGSGERFHELSLAFT